MRPAHSLILNIYIYINCPTLLFLLQPKKITICRYMYVWPTVISSDLKMRAQQTLKIGSSHLTPHPAFSIAHQLQPK